MRHEFHELTSDGACEAALSGAAEEVVGRTKRLGLIGGLSPMASRRPSEALSVAFLNSLMPWPRPLASSGNFFAPNRIKTTARIKMISPPPTLNRPNMMLIESCCAMMVVEVLTRLLLLQGAEVGDQRLNVA